MEKQMKRWLKIGTIQDRAAEIVLQITKTSQYNWNNDQHFVKMGAMLLSHVNGTRGDTLCIGSMSWFSIVCLAYVLEENRKLTYIARERIIKSYREIIEKWFPTLYDKISFVSPGVLDTFCKKYKTIVVHGLLSQEAKNILYKLLYVGDGQMAQALIPVVVDSKFYVQYVIKNMRSDNFRCINDTDCGLNSAFWDTGKLFKSLFKPMIGATSSQQTFVSTSIASNKTPNNNTSTKAQLPRSRPSPAPSRIFVNNCAVCQQLPIPPVKKCPKSQHLFCRKCATKKCVMCRPIKSIRLRLDEKLNEFLIMNVQYPCPGTAMGCTFVNYLDRLIEHEKTCKYCYVIECPGCNEVVFVDEYKEHVIQHDASLYKTSNHFPILIEGEAKLKSKVNLNVFYLIQESTSKLLFMFSATFCGETLQLSVKLLNKDVSVGDYEVSAHLCYGKNAFILVNPLVSYEDTGSTVTTTRHVLQQVLKAEDSVTIQCYIDKLD